MKVRLMVTSLAMAGLLEGCGIFSSLDRLCAQPELRVTTTAVGGPYALCDADTGDCNSLRTAIYTAAACAAGGDAPPIRLASDATYVMSDSMVDAATRASDVALSRREQARVGATGLPLIAERIEIDGRGAIIRRSESADDFRFIQVLEAGDLTLRNLTLGGGGVVPGGAVYNEGRLSAVGVTFIGNRAGLASPAESGGAIFNAGELSVIGNSLFRDNHAAAGSAIYNTARLLVSEVSFADNGTPAAQSSTLFNAEDATAQIARSEFVGNRTEDGAVSSAGQLTVDQSTFTENRSINAASIWIDGGTATIRRSSFFDEEARGAAVMSCGGSAAGISLSDVSIFGNRAQTEVAAALLVSDACEFQAANSIIAGNHPTDCAFTTANLLGTNVSSDASCSGFTVVDEVRLGALVDNGGPTRTLRPLPDSPVIDAGGRRCASYDQRDRERPIDGDGDGSALCDVGALELTAAM